MDSAVDLLRSQADEASTTYCGAVILTPTEALALADLLDAVHFYTELAFAEDLTQPVSGNLALAMGRVSGYAMRLEAFMTKGQPQ